MKIFCKCLLFGLVMTLLTSLPAFSTQPLSSGKQGQMYVVSVHQDTLPEFSIAPQDISFGNLFVGSTFTDTVAVRNAGSGALIISSAASTSADFSVAPSHAAVPASDSALFFVTFAPLSAGPKTGGIVFTHNASSSPDTVDVHGTGVTPLKPKISNVKRSIRVPLAGDSMFVTATVIDSTNTGIAGVSVRYTINGTTTSSAPMSLKSGTTINGTYEGVIPGSANADENRIEYQIMAEVSGGPSDTTAVSAANSYFAGTSSLSLNGPRTMNTNRKLRYVGYYARVTGTVNAPNDQTVNYSYYIQDANGGVNVFAFGSLLPLLNVGDSVTVVGKMDQFRGKTEIIPDTLASDIVVVASGRSLSVADLTVAAFQSDPEPYESRLIRFHGVSRRDPTPPWPPAGSSANIVMEQTSATDTVIMRIDSDYEIDGTTEPAYPVELTGLATQFTLTSSVYNNGYQIQPRFVTDFVPLVGVDKEGALPKTFALLQNYPNPFNPVTTIRFELPRDAYVDLKLYDLLGREVSHLVSDNRRAGVYTSLVDGGNLASGVYYYRLVATPLDGKSSPFTKTLKLMIMK